VTFSSAGFFNSTTASGVDEDDDVGPPLLLSFDDGELVDCEPVVALWLGEVDDLRLGTGDRSVGSSEFDVHAVDQHPVQRPVAGNEVRRLDPYQLPIGLADCCRRQARVETDQGLIQPILQDRVVISLVGALGAADTERNLGPVFDAVPEGIEPAERRRLGIGFGKARHHSGSARSAASEARSCGRLSSTTRQTRAGSITA
jgi:hypothetical protein